MLHIIYDVRNDVHQLQLKTWFSSGKKAGQQGNACDSLRYFYGN